MRKEIDQLETDSKFQHPKPPSYCQIRRAILFGAPPALLATACTISQIVNNLPDRPTLEPTLSPDQVDLIHQHSLSLTNTVMDQMNLDTSFVPEGEFTNSVYNRVLQSTFIMNLNLNGSRTTNTLTAWAVAKKGSDVYFATDRHAYTETDSTGKEIQKHVVSTEFYRPLLNESPIKPLGFQYANTPLGDSMDQAVFRCTLDDEAAVNIPTLDFGWKKFWSPGEKALIVGYPLDFASRQPNERQKVMGSIVNYAHIDIYGRLVFYGSGGHGNSGSPLVVLGDNNEPTVVAMLKSAWMENNKKIVVCTPLNIEGIIDQLS